MQHAQGRAPAARLPSKPSSTKSSRGRRAELSRHCPPVFRVSALHSAAALRAPIAQQWFCCPSSSKHPLAPWKPLKPLPLCSQPTSAHSWAELWRARTQSHHVLLQQIQGSREHTPVNKCKWKKRSNSASPEITARGKLPQWHKQRKAEVRLQKSLSHLCIHHTRGNQHSTFLPRAATEPRAQSGRVWGQLTLLHRCSYRGMDEKYFLETDGPRQASTHTYLTSPHRTPPSLRRQRRHQPV